jgi:hypothetical protein
MGNIVLVFRYEPFGIFSVFNIPIPKENSVSIFGILKLAGAPFSQRKGGASAPFCTLGPPFEEFPPNFQKKSSREIFKRCSRQIVHKKYPIVGFWQNRNTDTEILTEQCQ